MRLAALVLALMFLAGCGEKDEPEPAATGGASPAAAITPFPSIDGAELTSGTAYTTREFKPPITITPSSGEWKAFVGDSVDHFSLEPLTHQPVQYVVLAFHHMTKVFDPRKGGRVPGDAIDGPPDFAAWLQDHPHLRVGEPQPSDALGLKGVVLEVRVRSSQKRVPDECGKLEGHCIVLFLDEFEPVVYGEEALARFHVLEHDSGQIVVEQLVAPGEAFKQGIEQLDATLASARVG